MSNAITVWTDKNGVTREYSEVQRKAAVGELIKVVEAECAFDKYHNGDVFEVTDIGEDKAGAQYTQTFIDRQFDKGDPVFLWPDEFVTLEPTDVIHYDGRRYREVKRRAKVGELVLYVWAGQKSEVWRVNGLRDDVVRVDEKAGDDTVGIAHEAYRVLEPIAYESQAEQTNRLAALEERVAALETHIANIEASYSFQAVDTTKKLTEAFAALTKYAKGA